MKALGILREGHFENQSREGFRFNLVCPTEFETERFILTYQPAAVDRIVSADDADEHRCGSGRS